MRHATMMRACSIVMLAETIGSIAAKSGSTLGLSIIIFGRPMNELSVMVDVAVMPRKVSFVGSEATGLY
jgi:hypothetical protein